MYIDKIRENLSIFYFRELGIGIVAFSPLGKGFLTTGPNLVEQLSDNDFRKVCSIDFYVLLR